MSSGGLQGGFARIIDDVDNSGYGIDEFGHDDARVKMVVRDKSMQWTGTGGG